MNEPKPLPNPNPGMPVPTEPKPGREKTWPGWHRFLRGTAAIWRSGGGLTLTVADLWAGIRWWLWGA